MALFKRFRDIFSSGRSGDNIPEIQADFDENPIGRGRPFMYDPFSGNGTPPPNKPGVYWFLNEYDERAYYGETNNLSRRLQEHIRIGKIQQGERFVYKTANKSSSSKTRRSVEKTKIKRHNPQRNQRGGGGGRPSL